MLRLQPGPGTHAIAHRHVDTLARKVHHRVGRTDAHRQPRMEHLERADPGGQPQMRETVGATYRQHGRMVLRQRGEALPHLIHRTDHDRRDLPPLVGQRDLAARALEQAEAEPFLQQRHLIADRRLRHAEFARGGGEIFQPRGGFEHTDGGKRGQRGHGDR